MATSSTTAEFCALSTATKEAIWLKKLTVALGLEQPGPVPVYRDSANAIEVTNKMGYSSSVITGISSCAKLGLEYEAFEG